jgi:hypothetical protein
MTFAMYDSDDDNGTAFPLGLLGGLAAVALNA